MANPQAQNKHSKTVLGVGLAVALLFTLAYAYDARLGGTFAKLECQELDMAFRIRGPIASNPDVVIVAIDDESMAEMEAQGLRWPWPRSIHGQLVERLATDGAKVIAFDVVFDTAGRPNEDEYFAQAMKAAGNVILASQLSTLRSSGSVAHTVAEPISPMREAAAAVAYANMQRDADGAVRRGCYSRDTYFDFIPLARAATSMWGSRGQKAVDKAGERIRTDGTLQLNFAGPPATYAYVPYYQALLGVGKGVSSRFKGKIALVGDASTILHDTVPTPFTGARQMPGVEVHATAIGTMLDGNAIRTIDRNWRILLVALAGIVACVASAYLKPGKGVASALAFMVGIVAAGLFAFKQWDLSLPFLPTSIGLFASFAVSTGYRMVVEEREKRRIHSIFGRFVSKEVVATILSSSEGLKMGGVRRNVTMLFSDIRGFTSMSERLPAEDVVELLNEYFEEMTDAIFAEGGTVDKFIGDCIMAVFGAPITAEDHAARAVRAALAMRVKLVALQERWRARGATAFDTGIGINTGDVVVGNIGSSTRTEYTVIGSACNLAARLESATKDMGVPILLGSETSRMVQGLVPTRYLGEAVLRGIAQPVPVWTVAEEALCLVPDKDRRSEEGVASGGQQ